jgi:hypothetical protein
MNTVDLAHVRKTFSMPFNQELAAQYAHALPKLEAWHRNPTKEKTHIGLDVAGIRGVGTGHRGETNGPLTTYSTWASALLVNLIRGVWDIPSLASFSGFERWHRLLVESVEAYWQSRGFPELPRHQAYRLVDSFIKWMRTCTGRRPVLAQAILEHGHVIVNAPSLDALRQLCNAVPTWSTQMTRGDATAAYRLIQQLVREFCSQYGGTPLLFDVFARNEGTRLVAAQESVLV